MKDTISREKVGKDCIYKCPNGNCGYEITELTESIECSDENGTVFCPICGQCMLEVQ